ncbi:MAG: AMP-binding protein, partial [Alphaproteobacteria bacterium]|nr:AMP-binding protein [Alphaproteobacteria bacterium]
MFDVGRSFLAAVMRMPEAVAISDGDRILTYRAWQDDILRAVAGLDSHGLARGDHLVTVLQNRYEAATLHIAAQITGLVITPVNWRASGEELDYVLNDAEAKAVVFEGVTAETVAAAPFAVGITGVDIDHDWDELLAAAPAAAVSRATVRDFSVMLYTSGTTGRGKGVPRRQGAERAAAMAHVAQNQYARGEVTLGVMPLYHTMGVRSLLASILINGHFVCQRRFDPREALSLIVEHRVTNLYLVPTLYHDLLASPFFAGVDTSSVRKLGFAGQAMTDGLLQELDTAFKPVLFVNHYGSSEIYTFTIEPNAATKPGSAGKAGLNQEVRIITLDAAGPDDFVDGSEEGQIIAALDGDESFEGYWKRPDADEKSLHDGWYYTGDIGYRDGDGDIFVTGRVDDMIISGGENILPVEIESVLSLHPGVGEVAVGGRSRPPPGRSRPGLIVRLGAGGGEGLG